MTIFYRKEMWTAPRAVPEILASRHVAFAVTHQKVKIIPAARLPCRRHAGLSAGNGFLLYPVRCDALCAVFRVALGLQKRTQVRATIARYLIQFF